MVEPIARMMLIRNSCFFIFVCVFLVVDNNVYICSLVSFFLHLSPTANIRFFLILHIIFEIFHLFFSARRVGFLLFAAAWFQRPFNARSTLVQY